MVDSVKESSQNYNLTNQIDQTLNVVVTSSSKHSQPTLQNSHHDALALKDQLASLEVNKSFILLQFLLRLSLCLKALFSNEFFFLFKGVIKNF